MLENEKQELLQKINVEETINIKLTGVLNETTRLAGELRLNAETLEADEELKEVLREGSENMKTFNKKLTLFLSKR